MYQRELSGCAHYLQIHRLLPQGVKFMWQDVICKYWPWFTSLPKELSPPEAFLMKPALSIMHGKAHIWNCQVIYTKISCIRTNWMVILFLQYSPRSARSADRRPAGEGANIDRRLVRYTRDARRTKSRIEFIYLYIYIFIYMHQPCSSCARHWNLQLFFPKKKYNIFGDERT